MTCWQFTHDGAPHDDRPTVHRFELASDDQGVLATTAAIRFHAAGTRACLSAVLRGARGEAIGHIDAVQLDPRSGEVRSFSGADVGAVDLADVHRVELAVRIDTATPVSATIGQRWIRAQRRLLFFADVDHRRDADAYELRLTVGGAAPQVLSAADQQLGLGPQLLRFSTRHPDPAPPGPTSTALLAVRRRWYRCGSIIAEGPSPVAAGAAAPESGLDFTDADTLIRVLHGDDVSALVRACESVSFLALHAARSHVQALLTHPNAGVRAEAARALGVVGGLDLLWRLQWLLDDEDARVRSRALEAIDAITSR